MVLCFAVAAFAGCGPRPSSPDAASQISQAPPPKPSSSKPASSAPSSSEASSAPSSSAPSSTPASSKPAASKPASSKPSGGTGGTPASSTPTPVSTTTIRSGNTYSDKTYGNLLIHSDVEDDIVTLENVKITGTLIIEGSTQVELVDSTVNAIELNRYGSAVTITAEGKTTVNTLTAKSNVVLDESALSSGYKGFKKVVTSDNQYYYFIDVVLEDTDLDSIVLNTKTQLTENGSSDAGTVSNKSNLYTYEPSFGGGGGGSSSYGSITIDTSRTVNGGTYRNITISSAVGNGDVTLNNVRILGTLYINGGGKNSINLSGSTTASAVVINKSNIGGTIEPPSLRVLGAGVSLGSITINSQVDQLIVGGNTTVTVNGSNAVSTLSSFGGRATISLSSGASIGTVNIGGTGTITGSGRVGSVVAPSGSVTISSTVQGSGGTGSPTVTTPVDITVATPVVIAQNQVKLTMLKLDGIVFTWNNATLTTDKVSYTDGAYTLTVPNMVGGSSNTLILTAPSYNAKTLSVVWYAPSQKANVTFNRNPADLSLEVKKNGTVVTPESGNVYKLEPGDYTYTAKKNGYVDKTESFTVTTAHITSGLTVNVSLDTVPTKATVSFTPTDVTIEVKKGSTVIVPESGSVYKLEPGDYTYTAIKGGYLTKADVPFTVTQADLGKQKTIVVNLDAIPTKATVTFTTSPNDLSLVVKKNGVELTAASGNTYQLEPSSYTYTASKSGYVDKSDVPFTVTQADLVKQKTIVVNLDAIPTEATVTFTKSPNDLSLVVKKNGVELTAASGNTYQLEPGSYTYTASKSGYVSIENIEFTVAQADVGKQKTIEVNLDAISTKATVIFTKEPDTLSLVVKKGEAVLQQEANGTYKLEPGDYTYTASKSGYVTKTESFTVTAEQIPNNLPISVALTPLDMKLQKNSELAGTSTLSAQFSWGSTSGIGSGTPYETFGRYNYYTDGAYLNFKITKNGTALNFASIFDELTLQTEASGGSAPVDSIKGTESGRQYEDWNGLQTSYYTKLSRTTGDNYVFYGVRQTGTGSDKIRTVGFPSSTTRTVDMVLTPKADLEAGTYTVTIEAKQQGNPNSFGTITYTFNVE